MIRHTTATRPRVAARRKRDRCRCTIDFSRSPCHWGLGGRLLLPTVAAPRVPEATHRGSWSATRAARTDRRYAFARPERLAVSATEWQAPYGHRSRGPD